MISPLHRRARRVCQFPTAIRQAVCETLEARVLLSLPAGWSDTDIGTPSSAGSADYNALTDTWTVSGRGQITGSADTFHYAYRQISGDFELSARITDLTGNTSYTRAGIMLRSSLDRDAQFLALHFDSETSGNSFDVRRNLVGASVASSRTVVGPLDHDIKIARYQDNAYTSVWDETNQRWRTYPLHLKDLSDTVYVGFSASSGTTGSTSTASYSNVRIDALNYDYESSWVGNSFSGPQHIGGTVYASYVDRQTGQTLLTGDSEGDDFLLLDADGSISRGLGEGAGRAVAGDANYYYMALGAGGIKRVTHAGLSPTTYAAGTTYWGLVESNGELYASDPKANLIRVFRTSDMAQVRTLSVQRPMQLAVDNTGQLWAVQRPVSNATDLQSNVIASGGQWRRFSSNDHNSYLDLTVPNVPAGTYTVQVTYLSGTTRRAFNLAIDGAAQGSSVEQNSPGETIATASLGSRTFATTGLHTFRFTMLNADYRTDHTLSIDKITLVPTSGSPLVFEGESLAASVPASTAGTIVGLDRTTGTIQRTISFSNFSEEVIPRGIAVNPVDGHVYVTDIGVRQQVHAYNVSTGTYVSSFGDAGGIYSGIPGRVAAKKLNGPVAVGFDIAGNLVVASNGPDAHWNGYSGGTGTELRKFDATVSRALLWERYGLEFVDTADADPTTDGIDVYTKEAHYVLDYSKPAGQQWTYYGMTFDRFSYPDDARWGSYNPGAVRVRYVNGQKFLYLTGMGDHGVYIYRFAANSEVAIPAASIRQFGSTNGLQIWSDRNGNGKVDTGETANTTAAPADAEYKVWDVDSTGAVTNASKKNGYKRFVPQGLNAHGVPLYCINAAGTFSFGSTFVQQWGETPEFDFTTDAAGVQAVASVYDPASDTMWVGGSTAAYSNGGNKLMRQIVRYSNWSTTRTAAATSLGFPFAPTTPQDPYGEGVRAFAVAGDYLFTREVTEGTIRVYDKLTLAQVDVISPGPEISTTSCVADISNAITASQRSTGEYIVFTEDDAFGKVIMHRWTPPVEAETGTRVGASVQTAQSGYSGAGYVAFTAAAQSVAWTLNAPADGIYRVVFRYANGQASPLNLTAQVNGAMWDDDVAFAPTGGWNSWSTTSLVVRLSAGANTLRVTSTGSTGPSLDTVRLTPLMRDNGTLTAEAELAVGQPTAAPLVSVSDTSASGGSYLVLPGTGQTLAAPVDMDTGTGVVRYDFLLPAASPQTEIWLRVLAASTDNASFYVSLDGAAWQTWTSPVNTAWSWRQLNASFDLAAGLHTLRIAARQDGTRLDRILVRQDNPSGGGTGTPLAGPIDFDLGSEFDEWFQESTQAGTGWDSTTQSISYTRVSNPVGINQGTGSVSTGIYNSAAGLLAGGTVGQGGTATTQADKTFSEFAVSADFALSGVSGPAASLLLRVPDSQNTAGGYRAQLSYFNDSSTPSDPLRVILTLFENPNWNGSNNGTQVATVTFNPSGNPTLNASTFHNVKVAVDDVVGGTAFTLTWNNDSANALSWTDTSVNSSAGNIGYRFNASAYNQTIRMDNFTVTTLPTGTASTPPSGYVQAASALSRLNWTASASTGVDASSALDGSATTAWSSGSAQVAGVWFQLDLGTAKRFGRLSLDAGLANTYPRNWALYVSDTALDWGSLSPVKTGTGNGSLMEIALDASVWKRYIRIVLTGPDANAWNLADVRAYA